MRKRMTEYSNMELWHSSEGPLTRSDIYPGMHAGTREQAAMRRPGGMLHRIVIASPFRSTTMRDRGSWPKDRMGRASWRADMARYLNRYEGVALEDLEMATKHAEAPDRTFSRFVPSSDYSWIILRPEIVLSIEAVT